MKIQKTWALSELFYTSLDDPRIAKDVARGDAAIADFAKKYQKNKRWLTDTKVLAQALIEYEQFSITASPAPLMYPIYRKELDAKDKKAEALQNMLDERFTKRGNQTLFFELELAKIPLATQKKFLAAKELREFRYWLERLFETAQHNLSEPEEKLLGLLSDVSGGRWVQMTDNILNTRTVAFEGKRIPLNEAQVLVTTLPTKRRRVLHRALVLELKEVSAVAESELNAVVTRKKIIDELRGFKEPFDATILGYENDRASVLALVASVTKRFDIAQRFYKTKAKLLKEKKLTYADRAASIGSVQKKITFDEAAALVRTTFYNLKPRYAEIFDQLLSNGQVDIYPRAGKTGGAYCSGMVGQPTLVLLNHVENAHSLLTLAHEMGHAIHTEQSKVQPPAYQGYSTVTAETASTFFERAAFETLVSTLSEKERLVALHDKIQDDVSTVFRQIACFNFEVDLHKEIRTKGLLPKEGIAVLLNKHMSAYLGPAVTLEPEDGYFFVAWSHIRRFFYVYSYAYGCLTSRALWEKVKKDPSFIDVIDENFLQAGGSASVEDIFKNCGLDLTKPNIFLEGLRSIEKDVVELERALGRDNRI